MRVDVGVSSRRTKRGSKGSCCFFRGAKGPLNPSLYPAAAMLPKAARLNAFSPRKVYEPIQAVTQAELSENRPNVPASPGTAINVCDNSAWIINAGCVFFAEILW